MPGEHYGIMLKEPTRNIVSVEFPLHPQPKVVFMEGKKIISLFTPIPCAFIFQFFYVNYRNEKNVSTHFKNY